MQRRNAGNTQTLAVVAVMLIIAGAVAWMLFSPVDTEPVGGTEPVVEAGEDRPDAGTFEGPVPERPDGEEIGSAERVEVRPDLGPGVTGQEALQPGGVRGTVVDDQGLPIPDARVVLASRSIATNLFNPEPVEAPTPEELARLEDDTGADGRFYFGDLPGGEEFTMWVSHPSFGPESGPPVVILPGEIQEIGAIVLGSGYTLRGRVVDTAGNPLPASVELTLQNLSFFQTADPEMMRADDIASGRLRLVETDGNGGFEVEHLAQGIWTAKASAEGFASNLVRGITLVENKQPDDVEIVLDTEFRLTGIVVNQEDEPIAGAKVQVARVNPRPVITSLGESGPDGTFTLGQLPEGRYGMLVTAEGYAMNRKGSVVAGGEPLRIVMIRNAEITGRVSAPNGVRVSDFTLELLRPLRGEQGYRKTGKIYGFEGTDGSFALNDVDPGGYVLLARAAGFAPTYSAPFQTGWEDLQGIDIVMTAGGALTGRVIDISTGEGVPGVKVALRASGFEPMEGDTMFGDLGDALANVPTSIAYTQEDGSFRLDDVYVDRMALYCDKDGFLPTTVEVSVSRNTVVDVGRVEMRQGGTLSGTGVDAKGNPLAGGTVTLTRPGDPFQRSATLDARGRFRFAGLRTGSYEVFALPPADPNVFLVPDASARRQVYVEEGQTATIEVQVRDQQ
jgi:hypothetical protein